MDPRASKNLYPRIDAVYKTKQSLNFEVIRAKIYAKREYDGYQNFMRWLAHFLVGMFTGVVAFLMAQTEEYLTELKSQTT